MSSIVALLYDDQVLVGSDTLACKPWEEGETSLQPLFFTSKVYHLPHLKSVLGSTGYHFIGNGFYEFLRKYIGTDIQSILEIDLDIVVNEFRKAGPADAFGTIFLYGFDNSANIFKGFFLFIDLSKSTFEWKEIDSMEKEGGFLTKPQIDDLTNKLNQTFPDEELDGVSVIKRIVCIQKQEDDKKPGNEQVGIGGDIVLTWMGFNGDNFKITSEIIYSFPDKQAVFKKMLESYNARS